MNDAETVIPDARDAVPEVELQKRKAPAFGPGFVNVAIPDRGYAPSCLPVDFANAKELSEFAEQHDDWLLVAVYPAHYGFMALFQVLKTEATKEEMRLTSQFVEEKMKEIRELRAKEEAATGQAEAEKKAADDECRLIGRLCIEKHGAFVKELPGLSKIKVTRKSIADDILKLIEASGADSKELQKVLKKYVAEGA